MRLTYDAMLSSLRHNLHLDTLLSSQGVRYASKHAVLQNSYHYYSREIDGLTAIAPRNTMNTEFGEPRVSDQVARMP